MDIKEYVRELIKKADGAGPLSKALGISRVAVGLWLVNGVPADRVLGACAQARWAVTPYQVRPDLYPHPEDGLPAAMRRQTSTEKAA